MNNHYFHPNNTYDEAILSKNYGGLKALLVGVIASDPTFATTEFEEARGYIHSMSASNGNPISLEEPYQKQEGEYRLLKESEWTKKYFQINLVWLRDNFSTKERLPHIKEVGTVVYRDQGTMGKSKIKSSTSLDTLGELPEEDLDHTQNTPSVLDKESKRKYLLGLGIISILGLLIYVIFQMSQTSRG